MSSIPLILQNIENRLNSLGFDVQEPQELYAPMQYLTQMGGKRTRPLLLMLSFYLFFEYQKENKEFGLNSEVFCQYENWAYQMAVAVELFHNFTLAHDDVMDNSPERRGKPTLHIKYNTDTAILAGDALFAIAYQQIFFAAKHPDFDKITELFTQTVTGVCEGQIMDLTQAQSNNVSLDQYIEMIRRKTALLLGGAMGMGAWLAEADNAMVASIQNFAENIGIAFQLRDDYLDTFGDAAQFGKKIGGDIIENKKNFLWLKALDKANAQQKQQLSEAQQWQNKDVEKVKIITDLYLELQIDNESLVQEKFYYDKAIFYFEQLPQNEYTQMLLRMIEHLRQRQQ